MRASDLTTILSACLANDVFPAFWADPGMGKTETLKAFAATNNYELIHINCHSLESTDLVLPQIVGDSVHFIPCSWVKKALEATKPVLIFLDEVNRIKGENANILTSLILEKEVYGHRLPASTKFVAAANFTSKCLSTTKLDAAVMARFCHLLFDLPLTDSLPFMGSERAQEFILANSDLINESSSEADFSEVLGELEMNRRSLTWTMKMFEALEDSKHRLAVAQGLLGTTDGNKIAAAYELFLSEEARRFPTKIKGYEERLGELLAQGYVSEVLAIVQASIDKGLKNEALLFVLQYGNPELARNMVIANKGITATIMTTAELESIGLKGPDTTFVEAAYKQTHVFTSK